MLLLKSFKNVLKYLLMAMFHDGFFTTEISDATSLQIIIKSKRNMAETNENGVVVV